MKIDESWYQRPEGMPEQTCAGGVVVRQDGEQVWVAFAREKAYKDYVLPKGHVEAGEAVEETARREIEEEVGITDLHLVEVLGAPGRLDFDRTEWKVTHYFLFATGQVDATPTHTEQHRQMRWFPLNALPDLFWPEQKALLEEHRDRISNLMVTE